MIFMIFVVAELHLNHIFNVFNCNYIYLIDLNVNICSKWTKVLGKTDIFLIPVSSGVEKVFILYFIERKQKENISYICICCYYFM